MKLTALLALSAIVASSACYSPKSSSSTASSQDNSVDNSQHGISSCVTSTEFACTEVGPGQFVQTEECRNVNGEPVILNGPQPIDSNLAEACPTPTPIEVQVPA